MQMLDMFHLLLAGAFLGLAVYHYVHSLLVVMLVDDPDSRVEDVEFLKAVFFFALFAASMVWFALRQPG